MKLQTPHLLAFLATITLASFPLFAFAQVDVITEGLRSVLWFLVVQVFGTILGLAGVLFDYGINEFVINFGTQFSQNGIGAAVDTVWVVIRDFINMTFIFGLVYIGMKMILNSDDSNTRKWLANLIIAALLINFSLFFTKFIVDISNQFATTIAAQGFQKKDGGNEVEVSIALLDKLGVATIFNSKLDTSGTRTPGLGYIFGTALILIIATFVFAAGGILLIIRFAMLNLFMIFSPVMFLSFILPSLQSISSDYWRKFLGKAFFAPLYILFIYISFRILDSMKGSGAIQDGDLAGAFNTSGSAALSASQNTFPFFILASILLIGSLVIANKLGAEGAGKAISLGKSLSQKAQRGATIATKYAAAQTGGRLARSGSNALGNGVQGGLRRAQQLQGDGVIARATRRVARSNGVQGVVGGAAESMQKAKFGLSRTIEEEKKLRNQTNTNANNAMAISSGITANKEREAEEERRIAAGAAEGTVEVTRGGITGFAERKYLTAEEEKVRKEQDNEIAEMQRLAADMNIKQFEAMSEDEQVAMAQFMSGSLTDSVMKSDNVSDTQKKAIGDQQKKKLIESIRDESGAIIGEKLNNLSIRQIEILGDEFVTDNAALFNDSTFTEIKKSKKFSEGQVGRFIGARKSKLNELVSDSTTAERAFTQTSRNPDNGKIQNKARKSAEIAKLPGEVLANRNSARFITVDSLKAIASGDKEFERVSTKQREEILSNLEAEVNAGPTTPNVTKALNYLRSSKGQEDFLGQEKPPQTPTPTPNPTPTPTPNPTPTPTPNPTPQPAPQGSGLPPGTTVSSGGIIFPPSVGGGPRQP